MAVPLSVRLLHAALAFWRDEEAATSVEYALIALLIASAIAGVVAVLGGKVKLSMGSVIPGLQ